MIGRLYAILDVDSIARIAGEVSPELIADMASAAVESGVTTLQLRAKNADATQTLLIAAAVRKATVEKDISIQEHSSRCHSVAQRRNLPFASGTEPDSAQSVLLLLNDRPDLALLCGFDGCHLGQDDLSIPGARRVLARPALLGLSTHNEQQIAASAESDADYLAIGPIFVTTSKASASPAVGVQQLMKFRRFTEKPLVAIGGITRRNARSVLDAGADSIALISELMSGAETAAALPGAMARNCTDILAQIL